jgi:N-acetylglucosamine-6-phosphate deacetylase
MMQAVLNCIAHAGIPVEEAIRMASLYPARVLKLDDKLGKIAEGYAAEFVWLNEKTQLKAVYARGSLTSIAG